jgi:iron complex outermembrane receptor protein
VWRPSDHWQFNVNLTGMGSSIADVALVDQRNPGAGDPDAVVVKDVASGANCVIMMLPASGGITPADAGVPGFYVPAGGSGADAAYGVPHVNFGSCTAALPAGYAYTANNSGIPVSLKGNELPQAPNLAITVGAQYSLPLGGGYDVVSRVDYYWQSAMWTRIFNDDPVDQIPAWDVLNAQIQLNSPNQDWYARVFATNILDKRNMTNSYLTDASSGLFTNVFVEDPRIVGIAIGANY